MVLRHIIAREEGRAWEAGNVRRRPGPSAMVVEKDAIGPSAMVVEKDAIGPSTRHDADTYSLYCVYALVGGAISIRDPYICAVSRVCANESHAVFHRLVVCEVTT